MNADNYKIQDWKCQTSVTHDEFRRIADMNPAVQMHIDWLNGVIALTKLTYEELKEPKMSIVNEQTYGVKLQKDFDSLLVQNFEATEYKNPLVIYHGNCADGFSAAWCFHNAQEEMQISFDFHPGVYNETPPDCSGRIVYLVDFSYKADVVMEILTVADHVYLIDHHKTAIDDLKILEGDPKFTMYTDLERSGAMLAWDFLHNHNLSPCGDLYPGEANYKNPPLLLNHIQDRDLWKFKLAHTREISANVFSFEYTFENWDRLMSSDQAALIVQTVAGAAIERKHHKDIAELVKVCYRTMDFAEACHYRVPVASLPYTLSSDAGRVIIEEADRRCDLLDKLPEDVFAACYWDTVEHRIFSLRSNEDGADVSEIAKKYGGGGHRHAAGFKVPRTHPLACE